MIGLVRNGNRVGPLYLLGSQGVGQVRTRGQDILISLAGTLDLLGEKRNGVIGTIFMRFVYRFRAIAMAIALRGNGGVFMITMFLYCHANVYASFIGIGFGV